MELRTKSIQIQALLDREPAERVVAAFSMTPEPISRLLEIQVPPLNHRIEAMMKLQDRGWKLGLRFDPLTAKSFECEFLLHKLPRFHAVGIG